MFTHGINLTIYSVSPNHPEAEPRGILLIKKTSLSYYINQLMSFEYLQQVGSHINKGNRYRILYFDDYRKMREDVKEFLQKQLDVLID